MVWFLKTFWRSITFAATLVGLVFLASDFTDVPDAIAGWRRVFAMIDLTTALAIFSACALVYIFWIDARPLVEKYRSGERLPVAVHGEVTWTSISFSEGDNQYYKNTCYLIVHNHGRSGKTAKDVRVTTYTIGEPVAAKAKSGKESVDLHHGEIEWFEIGAIIAARMFGIPEPSDTATITESDRTQAAKGVSHGSYSLNRTAKSGIGLHYRELPEAAYSGNPLGFLTARVSAADLPTQEIKFRLVRERLESDDPKLLSPIEIVTIKTL